MIFTAWSHEGEWYGFRASKEERNACFSHELKTVTLELPQRNGIAQIKVNVSNSFWADCPELRGSKIRNWFNDNGYLPPKTIVPPKFTAKFINKTTIYIICFED
ncbi:MAG: hypothetical protein K2K67_01000 [Treponemataceae bacterium]|nr:hypothetical protein [Treponemataceae bacterium]